MVDSADRHALINTAVACINMMKHELSVLGQAATLSSFKMCLHIRFQCRAY